MAIFSGGGTMGFNDVVMEGVFDVRRLILSSVQPVEIGIILREEKFGLNSIDFFAIYCTNQLSLEIDRGRRGETV